MLGFLLDLFENFRETTTETPKTKGKKHYDFKSEILGNVKKDSKDTYEGTKKDASFSKDKEER